MTKLCQPLFYLVLFLLSQAALAAPTDELLHALDAQIVRVQVVLANGGYGVGSGVVVAQDQVATNCHVVANANSINVVSGGASYAVSAIKPDWHHDVCIIKVEGLNTPIASMGASKNLQYEQAVIAIGYPGFMPCPVSSFGFVKGLFAMDDSAIIRTSSSFQLGDSGGGLFDAAGNLVGLITLKSPGRNAYYYNMPVEWVRAALKQPEQAINAKSARAFWAESADKWPFFMRVVQPFQTEDWQALHTVAVEWTAQEPTSSEAWFYLAAAEYAIKDMANAEAHLQKVVVMNQQNSQAIYYLGLIAEQNGKHMEALTNMALLDHLDATAADQLKLAMGIPAK